MADDPAKRGKPDRDRLNIRQVFERRDILKRLRVVTEKGLREAHKAKGPMVAGIKAYLIECIRKA